MAIRDKNLNWKDDAMTLDTLVNQALRPIYEENKDKFEPEEIHYIVVNAIGRMITGDLVQRKRDRYIEFMEEKNRSVEQ